MTSAGNEPGSESIGRPSAGHESMRAGDVDRNEVVELLREALDNGRLSLREYDERVATAYRSVTYADLNTLLADLPRTTPQGVLAIPTPKSAARVSPSTPVRHRRIPLALMILWTIWGSVVAVNIAVWLMVTITTGYTYPWPIWVAVPAGAALLGVTIGIDWMHTHRDHDDD